MMPATSFSKTFKTESCLVTTSLQHCNTIAARITRAEDSSMVLQEVNLGFGIADIVIIIHDKCFAKNKVRPLSKSDVFIYKLIEAKNSISVEAIISNTGLRKPTVNSSLRKLEELEHIEADGENVFKIKNPYSFTISHSIAIEAKLKDWKRALKQAYRYKWFASMSYVLLDEANSAPARKNLAEFHAMGVGLMSIGTDGSISTIYDPDKASPIDARMAMMFNELVKEKATYH